MKFNVKEMTIYVDNDKNSPTRHVTLNDIGLRVRNDLGDTVEDYCLCNSMYIIDAMYRVGQDIWKAYHWLIADQICYLFMDNNDGRGNKVAIEQYFKDSLENYHIEIIYQVLI